MKLTDIKDNKAVLELLKEFETDTGTHKALMTLLGVSEYDTNGFTELMFALVLRRRPTSAKLKAVAVKHKFDLFKLKFIEPEKLKESKVVVKPVTKKPVAKAKPTTKAKPATKKPAEVKPKVVKELAKPEVKPAEVKPLVKENEPPKQGGESFKKGSFHLNRLGEVCELLEDYAINETTSSYKRLRIKLFNWNQMLLVDRSIEVYFNSDYKQELVEYIFDMRCTDKEYYEKDTPTEIKLSKDNYIRLGRHCNCAEFITEYDILLVNSTFDYKPNVKKGLLPEIDAIDNSTSLKNIRSKIQKIKDQKKLVEAFAIEMNLPNLKCNFDEIVSEITHEFMKTNNCDVDGQVKINNQTYKPSIYSKETLIKFCRDRNLLLTKDAIMSLSRLCEPTYYKQLVDNTYVVFIPDLYQQNLMLIKLCVELEKYSSAEDTLKLMRDEKVLYKISPKDAGGNFWYVYKCEEAYTKLSNSTPNKNNLPS